MKIKVNYQFEPKFRTCPACHTSKISAAFKSPDGVMCVKGFSIDSCSRCGLHFVNPQPTMKSLAQFYEKLDDTLITDLRKCNSAYYRKKLFADLIQPMKKHLKKGKILDFGCGLGLFVKALQEQGYQSYGIDHSERSIQTRREKLHLKTLTCGRLEDYRPAELFDCITAVAVLEHLKDPNLFIKNAHRQLKKTAFFFYVFHLLTAFSLKPLGDFIIGFKHLIIFTISLLNQSRECWKLTGFKLLKFIRSGLAGIGLDPSPIRLAIRMNTYHGGSGIQSSLNLQLSLTACWTKLLTTLLSRPSFMSLHEKNNFELKESGYHEISHDH